MAQDVRTAGAAAPRRRPAPPQEKRAVQRKEKKKREPHSWWIFYWGGSIDVPMFIITLVLLVIGIISMFSASHALSYRDNHGDSFQYASSQLTFALIGLVLMFGLSFVDYRIFLRGKEMRLFGRKVTVSWSHVVLLISLILTAMVIPFGVQNMENGPRRWLNIPIINKTFQPSDVLKFGVIIFMAYYIAVNYKNMRRFKIGLGKPILLFGVIAVLMMLQPHLSGLLIIGALMACMLYIGGINLRYVGFAAIAVAVAMLVAFSFTDFTYFSQRIANMWDPLADTQGETYQTYQAILAVGSGGFLGKGFDNSTQKFYYLPEAQNDFVYAVFCEEFGFVGGVLIILLFLIFVFRGFYIGRKSEDRFGMMAATGISLQVGIQAFVNIGVNVSALPNTGISMPFFSYGGTALLMLLSEIGIMLSISRRANLT